MPIKVSNYQLEAKAALVVINALQVCKDNIYKGRPAMELSFDAICKVMIVQMMPQDPELFAQVTSDYPHLKIKP